MINAWFWQVFVFNNYVDTSNKLDVIYEGMAESIPLLFRNQELGLKEKSFDKGTVLYHYQLIRDLTHKCQTEK